MIKVQFNVRLDPGLKDWLQEEAERSGVKTTTNYIQLLLEAARDQRILVMPPTPDAFPGFLPLKGETPSNPALISEE